MSSPIPFSNCRSHLHRLGSRSRPIISTHRLAHPLHPPRTSLDRQYNGSSILAKWPTKRIWIGILFGLVHCQQLRHHSHHPRRLPIHSTALENDQHHAHPVSVPFVASYLHYTTPIKSPDPIHFHPLSLASISPLLERPYSKTSKTNVTTLAPLVSLLGSHLAGSTRSSFDSCCSTSSIPLLFFMFPPLPHSHYSCTLVSS